MRFPHWRLAAASFLASARAPTDPFERFRCLIASAQWAARSRGRLQYDLARNGERIPIVGGRIGNAREHLAERHWARRTLRTADQLASEVPRGEIVILVDDASLDREAFSMLPTVALDVEGGSPPDGPSAVAALKAAMEAGGRYLALCWPSFWWLDYYRELAAYLEVHARVVTTDDDHILYAL